ENTCIIAAANQILRDDEIVGGIVEDARPRATALPRRTGLGIADIPDDIVVERVLPQVHLHVNGGADRQDVGEDVPGDAAIDVVDVPPGGIGMAHVPYHVAAEQHVLRAVEFGAGGLPAAFGVRPAAPFDQIVF